jgi:hypothetical protein
MLGRKTYTPEELAYGRDLARRQLAAYRALAGAKSDPDTEATYFNSMLIALDRPFVHRLRTATGKDGNPVNEVEMLVDSLMTNDGILKASTVIKYVPEESVLGLKAGDAIRLTADDFDRLATAFLDELERRFIA